MKRFNELYNSRKQRGEGKFLAGFNSLKYIYAEKTGALKLLDYFAEKDYEVISNETDNEKLVKRSLIGTLEFCCSYPLMLGTPLAGLITQNPYLMVSGALTGLLMNWDGEIKISNFTKRCNELGLDIDKIIEETRSKRRGKNYRNF